jgi:hypothetical protein
MARLFLVRRAIVRLTKTYAHEADAHLPFDFQRGSIRLGAIRTGSATVKMIAEYLDHAIQFERMAADETNPAVRMQFEKQAAAYRKLASERAAKLGLPEPPPMVSS